MALEAPHARACRLKDFNAKARRRKDAIIALLFPIFTPSFPRKREPRGLRTTLGRPRASPLPCQNQHLLDYQRPFRQRNVNFLWRSRRPRPN